MAGTGREWMASMDATALTVVATGVALFAALWRVQGNRFDTLERHMDQRFEAVDQRFEAVDKQFEAADKRWAERFEAADKRWAERFEAAEAMNRERFETAETRSRERFEIAEKASRERFEMAETASRERFETVERQSQATHAAVCALNGRFDDLYRHLLGPRAETGQPGPAPAG